MVGSGACCQRPVKLPETSNQEAFSLSHSPSLSIYHNSPPCAQCDSYLSAFFFWLSLCLLLTLSHHPQPLHFSNLNILVLHIFITTHFSIKRYIKAIKPTFSSCWQNALMSVISSVCQWYTLCRDLVFCYSSLTCSSSPTIFVRFRHSWSSSSQVESS